MNNQLVRRIFIAHNLKNTMEKVAQLTKEAHKLNIFEIHAKQSYDTDFPEIADEDTQIRMVGRDIEKEKIINLLLRTEANEDISIIPIVGLGGLGKSTLAESILLDKRVDDFDARVWVHVSEKFDLHKITRSVIKIINSSINLDNSTLQFLHDCMKKELATVRYLIVLDDLWEEDTNRLGELKRMLNYGCRGSKIIVTTRNQSVVGALSIEPIVNMRKICPVPASDQISLGVLSVDDCWQVMKRRAFGPDDDQSHLEEIGRQIAQKCGGLPLVANALGELMAESKTRQSWEDIRDTKSDLRSTYQDHKLENLALSYYFMKQHFKMCFIYLATFPKGFIIDSNLLTKQWNALGYISSWYDGQRCINYLLGMSFLHISGSTSTSGTDDKGVVFVSMHDVVHDLARSAMGNDLMVLDGRMETSHHKEYCRYAALRDTDFESKPVKLSSILPAHLRAIHWVDHGKMELSDDTFSFARCLRVLQLKQTFMKRLPSSICQLRRLRYLSLSDCSGLAELPKSWSNLINLLYLDLSRCSGLAKLPDSFGAVITLVDINLSGCSGLVTLPESFGDLANVLRITLSGCSGLAKLPESFGKVKNLVYLDLSFCSCFEGITGILAGLTNLEHLNLSQPYYFLAQRRPHLEGLKGTLCMLTRLTYLNLSMFLDPIFYYQSEKDNREFIESITTHLLHLEHLDLSHNTFLLHIHESLRHLNNLHTLDLTGCFRLEREQWMSEMGCIKFEDGHSVVHVDDGAPSSSNLVELEDVNCEQFEIRCVEKVKSTQEAQRINMVEKQRLRKLELRWTAGSQGYVDENALLGELVPPHSLLPNLTEVTMEDFPTCTILPPLGRITNLQCLVLRRMARITRIDAGELSGGNSEAFARLSKFTIDDMESLKEFTFAAVDELVIQKCPLLCFGPLPPRARSLLISDCDQVMSSWQIIGRIDGAEGPSAPVTELVVESCNLALGDWSLLHHLPGLCSLTINNCYKLTSSPEIIRALSSLQSLCFSQFHQCMASLPVFLCDLTSLQQLAIDGCHGIKSLPEDMLTKLTGLKALYIWDCPELKEWCESEENKQKLARFQIKFEKFDTSKSAVHPPEI